MDRKRWETRIATARTGLWHLRKGGPRQVAKWWRRRSVARPTSVAPVPVLDLVLDVPPPRRAVDGPKVRVASILDEFSARAWGAEFDLVALTPDDDPSVLEGVELLFVESAWKGNVGAWQFQLTGPNAPSEALRKLVHRCRERGIPSVFWNKEDPPHFEDFLPAAALFDHVCTTDANRVPHYVERLGHDRVSVLPFAAAEAVHNPARLRKGHQSRDVAFAGTYFAHKYPERRAQMDLLLGGALDVSPKLEHGLEIFSRFQGEDERYQFPGALADHVVGALDYEDMLVAYKAFKVFLNVNSVVDSPSMCARRIFEIVASGTPVVSTPSAAIGHFFDDEEVPVAHTREDAGNVMRALCRSSELRDRLVHRGQRRIWEGHTYRHRAAQVLEAAGLPHADPNRLPTATAIVSTNRPAQLEHVFASVGAQRGVDVQLALVTHGFDVDDARLRALAETHGVRRWAHAHAPADRSLGGCLTDAVALADGEVCSKMDDDDHYGPDYLRDLLHALQFSGADIVGKQAHYMYLTSMDATLLRFAEREHRWTDMVMGPTITARREVFERIGFSDLGRGEDSDFLRRALGEGLTIYSADRFNFIQRRSGGHTWDVTDRELLATGVVHGFGDMTTHVTC